MFDLESIKELEQKAMATIERGDKEEIENLSRNLAIFKDYYVMELGKREVVTAGCAGYQIIANLLGATIGKRYY